MAEDSAVTSISFPAIGTGRLGFPKDLVAQMLYDEISKFSSDRQTKRLTDVTIALHSGDTETQQVKRGCTFVPCCHLLWGLLNCGNTGKQLHSLYPSSGVCQRTEEKILRHRLRQVISSDIGLLGLYYIALYIYYIGCFLIS